MKIGYLTEDDWDIIDAMGHSFGEDMCCMRCEISFKKHQSTGLECKGDGRLTKMGRPATTMRGHRNSQAKLLESQVLEIRSRKEKGELNKDLAKRFGVSTTTICDIHRGVRWAHLLTKTEN